MRLHSGVDFILSQHYSVGVAGGYVFDRFYFEGQRYSDRVGNEIDVGHGPFLMIHGLARW